MYKEDLIRIEKKVERMEFEIEVLQTQMLNLYQLISTMVKKDD